MRRFTVPFAYIAAVLTVFSTPLRAETIEEPKNETVTQKESIIEDSAERKVKALSQLNKRGEGEKKEDQHIEVGTRTLPQSERVEEQEERARIAALRSALADEEEAEGVVQEEKLETEERSIAIASEDTEEALEEVTSEEIIAKATYYTWHQGAHHKPTAVSVLGDFVTLHDGTEYHVKYSDRHKTLDWLATDTIIILPNHAWFSSHYFRLVNQMTGADVQVNLHKGPFYNGVHTHWVIAIDYHNCEVCLEDGTIWHIGEWTTLKKWLVNDTVIIGINDSWFSSKPNILINVNMNNYVSSGPSQPGYILTPITTP